MEKVEVGKIGVSEGKEYKVLARSDDNYVLLGLGRGNNFNWNYEVHKIRVSSNGKKEILAESRAFGEYAWGYNSLDTVREKWHQFRDYGNNKDK
jgi:hypothetical protein